MTTQTVNIDAYAYSGTLSAKLRDPDTIATVVATASSVSLSGAVTSRIVCVFSPTLVAAGDYLLELIVNGTSYILYVTLTGVDGEVVLAVSERSSTDILNAITALSSNHIAVVTVDPNVIANFPSSLIIGDSYTPNTGQIKIAITDSSGDPTTGLGSLIFEDADISFTAFRPNDSALLSGTCTFVDSGSETYVLLTLPSSETSKGKAEFTYEGRLKFDWTLSSEQKTYPTTPFKFLANP